MKKSVRTIAILIAVIITLFSTSVVAYAGESFNTVAVSTSWKEIAADTAGFNCNVKIVGQLITFPARIDVLMTDQNDNYVWSETNSCPGNGYRVYYCGSNVYHVYVKVSSSSIYGSASALKTSEPAT